MENRSPWLVIMAAGMGSRFGGLKQITPVDDEGHFIIDYSLYDAWRAGFRNVAFVIKRETEQEFREKIINRIEKYFHVAVVYQDNDNLPEGFTIPEDEPNRGARGMRSPAAEGSLTRRSPSSTQTISTGRPPMKRFTGSCRRTKRKTATR